MAKKLLHKLVGILTVCALAVTTVTAVIPAQRVSAESRDCEPNAVLHCGAYSLSELKTKYRQNQGGNVDDVFRHFHINNESYLNGMVEGRVTNKNEVWVGNKKVADRAVTAGRKNMKRRDGTWSIPIVGDAFYMRNPSDSFKSPSLKAFVKMDDETFKYAVIMSCGNPVNAFPTAPPKPQPKPQPKSQPQPKKPELEIKKDVRALGDSDWEQEVTADPGDQLQYMITVTNTGETDLKNVQVRDSLPGGVSFQDGELDIAPTPNDFAFPLSELVGEGINLGTIPKGEVRQITFTVTVGQEVDACEEKLRNVAHAEADDVPEEEDDALAKACQPEEEEQPPQVKGEQTPPVKLPETGAAGVIGIFSVTSFLGWATYKLKEFYSLFLR